MSKKKAIDRALRALPLSNHSFYREVLENLWAEARAEARIAGIREAAKLTDGSAFAVQAHSIGWRKTLENHANALAKKARPK